ncbi:hypothetical protein CYMTET_16379 [Cymbomonas tetramitiformis]|uniref:RNase H type-1 domain-containing protein n=1 Tax=Cymbomonas tetramitiformis TaxID=36881 RepID=A0AAE0L7Z8_9CHLO|nr:hypothetical protein CYMTET_16379 [Cymbomonas tetramitiformis]
MFGVRIQVQEVLLVVLLGQLLHQPVRASHVWPCFDAAISAAASAYPRVSISSTCTTASNQAEPTPSGVGTPGATVSPPAPSLEVQLLLQQMKHQQEAHDAALKIQQAERKQHDLQSQLLTEQISALRADAAKARSAKDDGTSATTSTGDAELEKLRRLPYCPYAPVNPFPPRPDTLTDSMPKLFDLYGDKTHAALSKKSNSSMKYEQMVLGPALAYFHDAIVYEEEMVDLLQNLPEAEYTPFLDELWNRVLRGHNTKKGVYGLLCNRYTMIGYRAVLEGDNEAHGGADAARAKLAFMEQKIYAGLEGVVADTVLTKWLSEFDSSKAKSVMTVAAKQAAGAANRAQRSDHRVGGGRGGDRALPPNSPGQTAYGTGVCAMPQRSMARWRREQRSTAMDHSRSEDAVGEKPTTQVRPRDLSAGSDAAAAEVVGHRDGQSSTKEARGFWNDELQKLHITHLKVEAVYKTVRSLLSELEGKVVRLYCDNQAVVAMLSHFTSRNPELMRRMRKLWLLLDLHDIELQARYIRSEANQWADRLSRDKDLDDWRISKRWFKYAEEQWGEHSVDRFASEISAQLPRYYSAWHDPGCEGVDSLAYDWRGEHNWVNPPWGLLDEVAHKLREEGAAATVVAPYWPGQSWFREQEALAAEVDKATRRSTSQKKRHWTEKLGDNQHSDTAAEMQAAALEKSTADNYERHWKKFMKFCTEENLQWLPATAATV